MTKWTDETVLTFGKHRGKALANVPAWWLMWYYENAANPIPELKAYIEGNKMALMQEIDLQNIKNNKT